MSPTDHRDGDLGRVPFSTDSNDAGPPTAVAAGDFHAVSGLRRFLSLRVQPVYLRLLVAGGTLCIADQSHGLSGKQQRRRLCRH